MKIIKIDLGADAITDLSLAELQQLSELVKVSLTLAKKKAKSKKGAQGTLFGGSEFNTEISTTFEKSNAYTWAVFEKELLQAEQMGVDIKHYYDSVKNWSLKNTRKKRTARGWIATAIDFMRGDKQRKKLVMIDNIPAGQESSEAMVAYLKL